MAAGFRYVRGDPVVGPVLLTMFVVGLAGFNFPMVMPLMAKYTFHLSAAELSLPVSLSAVGALVAGVVMAGLKKPTVRIVGIGAVLFGALLIAYGDAPNYLVWVVISFPVGVAATVFTTVVVQILQKASPRRCSIERWLSTTSPSSARHRSERFSWHGCRPRSRLERRSWQGVSSWPSRALSCCWSERTGHRKVQRPTQ